MTDTQASTATPAVGRTQTATNPPAAKPETPPPAEDRPPRGKVVRILAIVAVVMGVLFIGKCFSSAVPQFANPAVPKLGRIVMSSLTSKRENLLPKHVLIQLRSKPDFSRHNCHTAFTASLG